MKIKNCKYNIIFVVLLVVSVFWLVSCGESPKPGETYPEKAIGTLDKAKAVGSENNMNALRTALNAYYADNNEYPVELQELVPDYLPNAAQLKDAWGGTLKLEADDDLNYWIVCSGRDQMFGTADDIKRSL